MGRSQKLVPQGVTYLQRRNKYYVSHYQLLLAVRVQLR